MIQLDENPKIHDGCRTPFHLGIGAVKIWLGSSGAPRVYSSEFLPSLFERSIVIEEMDLQGGAFEWIFTGELGGVTVRISPDTVTLSQRYYDSFALNEIENNEIKIERHPEKKWLVNEVNYEGKLTSATVTLDHRLEVAVALNGQEVLRQQCLMDLSQHQLGLVEDKGHVKGAFVIPPDRTASVQINIKKKHQQMLGFGGITPPAAYHYLSPKGKQRWWELLAEYNLLVQREYPNGDRLNEEMSNWDRLDDSVPHYYGDNFPNSEMSDFEYIKTIRKLGGRVLFEFWSLPAWASQDWVADPDKYTKAMVGYCKASKERVGAPPDVVGIQNEIHQPVDIWYQMTLKLRRELDAAGFQDVKIHMSDAPTINGDEEAGWPVEWRGVLRAQDFKKSAEVWKTLDYTACHMYDIQSFFHNPDGWDETARQWNEVTEGKPFLSTELCLNDSRYQIPSYRVALTMGQFYHKNLVLLNASALCYCWTLLNVTQPSFGWSRTLLVPDMQHGFVPKASSNLLRVFGSFSRRVKEKMVRMDATSSDSNLLVSAYIGARGKKTVVLLNRGNTPVKATVNGIAGSFKWMELTDQYHENAVLAAPATEGDETVVTVAPGAIVTLTDVPLGALPRGFQIED